MREFNRLEDIDAVVLCGGLGERLRAIVPHRPKPLAEIGGRPFLDILLDHVSCFGLRRFILCTGYKGELIQEYYARQAKTGREVSISWEEQLLGTAGALRHAVGLIRSPTILVLNGDSLCRTDLRVFWSFHVGHGGLASMILAPQEQGSDYGVVTLNPQGRIGAFMEKSGATQGQFINAGIYLFSALVLKTITASRASSLEHDLLPALVREGQVLGWPVKERVIDIGTPQRYVEAQRQLHSGPD